MIRYVLDQHQYQSKLYLKICNLGSGAVQLTFYRPYWSSTPKQWYQCPHQTRIQKLCSKQNCGGCCSSSTSARVFFLALCIMREIVLTLLISQLLADGSVDMVIPSGCRADNFLLGEAWRFKEFYYLHLQIS